MTKNISNAQTKQRNFIVKSERSLKHSRSLKQGFPWGLELEEANGDDGKQQFEESNPDVVDDDFFYNNLEQTKIKKSSSSVKKKSKTDSLKKLKSNANLT